jgi:hypothetical protein
MSKLRSKKRDSIPRYAKVHGRMIDLANGQVKPSKGKGKALATHHANAIFTPRESSKSKTA